MQANHVFDHVVGLVWRQASFSTQSGGVLRRQPGPASYFSQAL
jgi:hypothetical protein